MKKIAAIGTIFGGFFLNSVITLAQSPSPAINVAITPPGQGVNPFTSISQLLTNALIIVFVAAALIVLFMLIIGAFQWITSGGDKEAVGKARGRITNALIGLAILALAFLIVRVVGQVLSINVFDLKYIPTLSGCPNNQHVDPNTGQCVS
ncbi:MAG: pilin [Patescibacteria group bacterium]|nr:pilin [Patescibacteria group bacterium]